MDPETIPLREVIASDFLLKAKLQLNGQLEIISSDSHPTQTCSSSSDGSISPNSKKSFCLNATKLALLLAKAFAKLEVENKTDLAFLQLDNFFVNFQLEVALNSEDYEKYYSGEKTAQAFVEEEKAQQDFGDDFDLKNLSISGILDGPSCQDAPKSRFPTHSNALGVEIATSREEKTAQAFVEEEKAQQDCGDDFDLENLSISGILDGPSCQDSPKSQFPAHSNALGIEITTPRSSTNAGAIIWTLLDIDFQPISRNGPSLCECCDAFIQKKISPIQILGNLIHAIFSQNHQEHFPLINHKIPTEIEDFFDERTSKQKHFEGSSLFSTLFETGDYPVSVCRLLSDMIDVSGGEQASTPFTSFDEVVQDLEQMSNHPQIFLHDQSNEFYSSSLHFGQRCHGRVKELKSFLAISTELEQSESLSSCDRSEAVFVSGAAGSGKSHFVQHVGRFLSNLGWMFLWAKFKREMEHGSREIVSSLFDKLVENIVEMKSSNDEADIDYHRRATLLISDELDPAGLVNLANFIPSINDLFPDLGTNASSVTEMSLWQLVFLLSKLMKAVLSLGRKILMCFDDLQWCDSTMLTLIKEIIMSVGQNDQGRHFLFVGMYRNNEVSESHSFSDQLAALQKCNNVHVAQIKLSSLSTDEVADMMMSEMRLPRRLVSEIARAVHQKTSGHAIFVVQVLNSLVRDATIAYSPRMRRFGWDKTKIATLRMGDSVASWIVSNLSSLHVEALQTLRILSCFGVQIPLTLLRLVGGLPCIPEGGIESFLPGLVEGGAVDMSGSSVLFSHDLIQQHVYENIPTQERRHLHLDIGTFLASEIGLEGTESVEAGVEKLILDESSVVHEPPSSPSYPLVAITTNQINFAGLDSVSDRSEQIRFAGWNLCAGKFAADRSDLQAALYYYKSGIAFLGDGLWLEDSHQLCHDLHEASASAFFESGDHSLAVKQANVVIDNIPFEDSLVSQFILIRALVNSGRYVEAVANGLDLLRLLKIDIPLEPCPSAVMSAMVETGQAVSAYSFDQITNTKKIVDAKKRNVMRCANALVTALYRLSSPYLPLVGCAFVNYAVQNGICEESATAFMIYGYFKVIEGKYEDGHYWSNVVLEIIQGATSRAAHQTGVMVTMHLNFLYYPLKELAIHLLKLYHKSTSIGEFEMGLTALLFSLTLSFYSGEKLSLISKTNEELISTMTKYSKETPKFAQLNKILIEELMGSPSWGFPDFGGVIRDEHSLLIDAQIKKNVHLVEAIHFRRFNSAFWMGDYTEASKCSQDILALPSSKMPKIQSVIHTFFMGLIAFQLYRDGKGEEHLSEGKKLLDKMEIWSNCSAANFINKLQLLEAEHCASMCDIYAAKAAFEASARSARDFGLVQEQGLACELYGKFLSSIVETNEALRWLKCAHTCYVQWGAVAKANQIWKDHELDLLSPARDDGQFENKHGREW